MVSKKEKITPDYVLSLKGLAENYLCGPQDNVYDIQFTHFKIRDLETGVVLYDIEKPSAGDYRFNPDNVDVPTINANGGCFIQYRFTPEFLKLKFIGATIEFAVGNKPLKNFRMIERHFFKEMHLKTFDFDFGYCMPNTKNSYEHIYELPNISPEMAKQMIEQPYEVKSDSFYFADGQLIMHNKAEYAYDADYYGVVY